MKREMTPTTKSAGMSTAPTQPAKTLRVAPTMRQRSRLRQTGLQEGPESGREAGVEEEEEESECSATQCLQPVADQIIWVQCDHCQEWFHCVCVGLTKEYAEQIDMYKCATCKQLSNSSSSVVAPQTKVGGLQSTSLSPQQPPQS